MADFRRSFIVLAALALLIGTVTTASAANMSCVAGGATPTQMRAEGETELAGDLVITCNGGTPTDPGYISGGVAVNSVPTANIEVSLNTSLTSRILESATNGSEALLLINEPAVATQKLCTVAALATCGMLGQGALATDPYNTGTLAVNGSGQAYNVFQGQQVNSGSVTFNGVPIDAPGTQQTLVIRITNIRANANGLGVTSVNAPPISVTGTISTSGTVNLNITNNAQQVIGQVLKGLVVSNSSATTYQQCTSQDFAGPGPSPAGTITFAKGFASSFKVRSIGSDDLAPSTLNAQDVLNTIYTTETGFYNPAFKPILASTFDPGAADYGTRLRIIFAGVQAGVTIWVPNNVAYDDVNNAPPATDVNTGAPILSPTVNNVLGQKELYAQLITSEGGSYAAAAANGSGASAGFTSLTVSSTGTAEADYEVITVRTSILQEFLAIPFYVTYTANPGANSPGLGTATVGGSFAPISTDTSASATDSIPRFADTSVAVNSWSIVKCATHILFPFVTNQANFDTGMAIANTSMDQYGTSTQTGTCTFNFFGANAPAAVTTASDVAPGTVYANLTSVMAPGFQGYVIVDCQFQFAHGFAFITQIGTFLGTEGYLALIIPDPPNPRLPNFPAPGPSGEQLSN